MVETRGEQENRSSMESSNIDELTMIKSTSPVLLSSVVAGVASVVCSYNLANGMYAS